MNRRSYIKSILALTAAGAASATWFKWHELNKPVDARQIAAKRAVVAELADIIIPRTDTPGAKDVDVADYVIAIMTNCSNVKEQNNFLSGIQGIEDYASDKFGKDFLKCSLKEKQEALRHFAKGTRFSKPVLNRVSDRYLGAPFFPKFKSLVVEGFCLSKPGATQALAYDYIPGSYLACIPLKPGQKAWATK